MSYRKKDETDGLYLYLLTKFIPNFFFVTLVIKLIYLLNFLISLSPISVRWEGNRGRVLYVQ